MNCGCIVTFGQKFDDVDDGKSTWVAADDCRFEAELSFDGTNVCEDGCPAEGKRGDELFEAAAGMVRKFTCDVVCRLGYEAVVDDGWK